MPEYLFNKAAGLRPEACNFIKKEAMAHVFSCESASISANDDIIGLSIGSSLECSTKYLFHTYGQKHREITVRKLKLYILKL